MLQQIDDADSKKSTLNQTNWAPYGLFKPMAAGNKPEKIENYHIQPIETSGIKAKSKKIEFLAAY